MVIPFVLLLGAIAVLPLIPATEHWWESNLHRFLVAAGLGALTLALLPLAPPSPIEAHWPVHRVVAPSTGAASTRSLTATCWPTRCCNEYIPFIVLLFSLYTISGGIRIEATCRRIR